jgi:hypothetical protein
VTAAADVLRRIEARDASLWPSGNTAPSRLGWLDAPRHAPALRVAADDFAEVR